MGANKYLVVLLLAVLSISSLGQTMQGGIRDIASASDTLRARMPIEKLYIQFDQPYYSTGDTIWLKAYLFDAAYLAGSAKSGIVYIELANDTNKVILQRMLPVTYGIGAGNIVLNKDDIPEGSYTIRAYTNLMRNFGEDLVFRKNLYISASRGDSWLVNSNAVLSKKSGMDNVAMDLKFTALNKQVLGLYGMNVRVLEGRKVLFRDKMQTDIEGGLNINFDLPEKTDVNKLSVEVENPVQVTAHKTVIPVDVSRMENADLQFMPEGGYLTAGILSKVGFKAIGEDGRGLEISGKVYSGSDSQEAAVFNSTYKGMGSFELTPKQGESYKARVIFSNGSVKDFPLPPVRSTGTTLRIVNKKESDSLEINISISPDLTTASNTIPVYATSSYYLVGESRGIILYGAVIRFNGNVSQRKIAKSIFPTGITKFTLLTSNIQPLNERAAFIDHHDDLNITITPDKSSYKIRDSISFAIKVTDKNGQPVQGSFSMAVTDDAQVKTDSLSNNLLTSTLLTSGLKGTIENPGHYFQSSDQSWTDLDNLLLTQGWTGYEWKDRFDPAVSVGYEAEPEFLVKGRVSNVFNKGVAGTGIRLLSSRPVLFMDGLTNPDGSFAFAGFPIADTLKLFIQAMNKKEKSFNVGVEVEEFKATVFKKDPLRAIPWYVNTDTMLLKYVKTVLAERDEEIRLPGGNILNEVTITAKKVIKSSHNLNGPGNADIILDQKDMDKAKKKTAMEILMERISGLREIRHFTSEGPVSTYRVYKRPVIFVVDGIILDPEMGLRADILMDYMTAEDIKGIEVMLSGKYLMTYINFDPDHPPMSLDPPVYLEITTWSGNGAYMRKTSGTYLYKPMPFTGTAQFYRPKYIVKNDAVKNMDMRSTIHWAPNIITDKEGKAVVSFYSSDSEGTYTIITEGSDMNGNLGSTKNKILISP